MRLAVILSATFLAFPLAANAGFRFEATPSTPQPEVGTPARFPSPYAHPRALPVAHPPPARPIAVGESQVPVPLRSALLNILPPDIHPTYTQTVDPDALVSWRGGRPWDVVLRDAVKPLGIQVAIKDHDVTLSR